MVRKAVLSVAVIAALGAVLFGLRWCSPPPPPNDFSRPDNDGGTRPPAVDRDVNTRVTNKGNPYSEDTHTQLNCNVVYKIGIVAREPATCEGYRFANLIARATVPIQMRINQLTCPAAAGCPEKVWRFTWVKTECRNNNATAEVKAEVMCRPQGGPAWPGINPSSVTVTMSTQAAAPGEGGGFDPNERRAEWGEDQVIGSSSTWMLNCPQAIVFSYRYEEFDRAGCGSITDYRPYVDRAVARFTTEYYAPFSCAPGCTKQPLAILRKEWSCNNASSTVVVRIWAKVECK
jgi:hypothetical protein